MTSLTFVLDDPHLIRTYKKITATRVSSCQYGKMAFTIASLMRASPFVGIHIRAQDVSLWLGYCSLIPWHLGKVNKTCVGLTTSNSISSTSSGPLYLSVNIFVVLDGILLLVCRSAMCESMSDNIKFVVLLLVYKG